MRIQMAAPTGAVHVKADKASRTITGTLIPFGSVGTPSVGPARIMFAADGDHVAAGDVIWLNREHDQSAPLGKAEALDSGDVGISARFHILDTSAGSDALAEAAAGARTGLSVEAEIRDYQEATDDDGAYFLITASTIHEAALVRFPAFSDARATDVAATVAQPTESESPMSDPVTAEATSTDAPPAAVAAAAPAPRVTVAERVPTAADFIVAMGRGDHDRVREFRRMVQAAAPHTFVSDIPGLIPEPIVGPVVSLRDGSAPLFNALGPNAAPEGASFNLPVITTELANAQAATEKTDVTGQLVVDPVAVQMSFVKRAANISAEAIQYSQPGVVNVALQSLADAVNLGCESVVHSGIASTTGTNTGVELAADGSDAWAKLADAVAGFYAATGTRPDVFACGSQIWAELAGMTNSLGQPLISTVSQNLNGNWGTLFGIPVVVSPAYGVTEADLLSTQGVKSWASGTVQMQANEPTIMGFSVGAGRNVGVSVASPKFITPVSIAAPAATRSSK